MVTGLGIMQFLSIAINCIYELKRKSTAIFLWAVLIVMFGIPHMLSTMMGTYKYSDTTMKYASVFVILFCLIYLLTRYIVTRNKENDKRDKVNLSAEEINQMSKFMKILFYILIIIVFIRCATIIHQGGGILNTTWETMRETSQGGYFSFSQIFIILFFTSSSCIILAIRLRNKKIAILGTLLVLMEVIISRNRVEILPLFVTIIYIYIITLKLR